MGANGKDRVGHQDCMESRQEVSQNVASAPQIATNLDPATQNLPNFIKPTHSTTGSYQQQFKQTINLIPATSLSTMDVPQLSDNQSRAKHCNNPTTHCKLPTGHGGLDEAGRV